MLEAKLKFLIWTFIPLKSIVAKDVSKTLNFWVNPKIPRGMGWRLLVLMSFWVTNYSFFIVFLHIKNKTSMCSFQNYIYVSLLFSLLTFNYPVNISRNINFNCLVRLSSQLTKHISNQTPQNSRKKQIIINRNAGQIKRAAAKWQVNYVNCTINTNRTCH